MVSWYGKKHGWQKSVCLFAAICCLIALWGQGEEVFFTKCNAAQGAADTRQLIEQQAVYEQETAKQADTEITGSELHAISAVLMDAENGRVLYEKDGGEFRANASTTKILTCILALEYGHLDDTVIVSSYAAKMPDVQLQIREGEKYRLKDLLYSMMLESHNDSAVAVAEQVGGSVEHFSEMMNQKAKDIGCHNTYFITPNGLDAEKNGKKHGTTARDLARILRYCIMESPERDTFLEITGTQSYSFTDLSKNRSFTCTNHNAFLSMMDGALTGKTGFTGDAGYCYVGALEKNGHTFIVALLGCGWPNNKTYKWQDTKKLMQYALDNYTEHTITEDILQDMSVKVTGRHLLPERASNVNQADKGLFQDSSVKSIQMKLTCSFSDTLLFRNDEQVSVMYHLPEELSAPVNAGTQVGTVSIYIGDVLYDVQPVYLTEAIVEQTAMDFFKRVWIRFFTAI